MKQHSHCGQRCPTLDNVGSGVKEPLVRSVWGLSVFMNRAAATVTQSIYCAIIGDRRPRSTAFVLYPWFSFGRRVKKAFLMRFTVPYTSLIICPEYEYMPVRLSVRPHNSTTTRPNFTPNFVPVNMWRWLGPALTAFRYDVMHFRFCG